MTPPKGLIMPQNVLLKETPLRHQRTPEDRIAEPGPEPAHFARKPEPGPNILMGAGVGDGV